MALVREQIYAFQGFKISVSRQKFVIICATRTGGNQGILAAKISVLRKILVIICNSRAGQILGDLAFYVKN